MVRDHLAGQRHLAVKLGGIEDEKDGLGLRLAFNLSAQGAHRDALVLRRGHRLIAFQAPYTGQVEQTGARSLDQPFVLLHGDAGVVANLLAQAGEPVEDGGLAYIGGPIIATVRNPGNQPSILTEMRAAVAWRRATSASSTR